MRVARGAVSCCKCPQSLTSSPFTSTHSTYAYSTCTYNTNSIKIRAFHSTRPLLAGKRDPFEVLGVVRGASKKEIKKAYLEKVKRHHPDQNAGSTASFIEIQEAYESLQGIVTMRSTTSSHSSSSSTTYQDERVRTRGHGYTTSDEDMYSRMNRDEDGQAKRTFHETVQTGHIPLVFVIEWNTENTVLSLRTHTFKSRSHPNNPAYNNTEKMFAYVQHSKLDNGAPCIDLMWEDGSIIAKCFSQSHAKFHNPKNNASPSSKSASQAGHISVAPAGAKMSPSDGKMVVEDADGGLMGYITEENTWLYRGFKIETTDEEGTRVGRASWSKFSATIVECEDEFGKKVATGLQQDTKWIMHLSPLASISQHEISPLFWIFVSFWVK